MNNKLVSIVIITHNRSELLKNAIQSALAQTYKNIEIIVVDDYSQDNTTFIMQKFQKEYAQIKYIKLEKQSGANVARNKGITLAKGYYITGLDDDDSMLTTRVEKLVNAYDEKYAYTFSQIFYTSKTKKVKKIFKYFKKIITLDDMLYTNCTGNQVLTTKKMFIDAGLYDETLISAQDYDMWLKLLLIKPKAKLVREALMNVDRDDEIKRISSSKRKIKGYYTLYKKYRSLMNIEQRKFQLFKLSLQRDKPITIKSFFMYLTFKNIILYLYLVLKNVK